MVSISRGGLSDSRPAARQQATTSTSPASNPQVLLTVNQVDIVTTSRSCRRGNFVCPARRSTQCCFFKKDEESRASLKAINFESSLRPQNTEAALVRAAFSMTSL